MSAGDNKVSTVNALSALSVTDNDVLVGTFEPVGNSAVVVVTVLSPSVNGIGTLSIEFSEDGEFVDYAHKILVTRAQLGQQIACACSSGSFCRVKFKVEYVHDSRSTPSANTFTNLSITTQFYGKGEPGDFAIDIDNQVVQVHGIDLFETVSSFPNTRIVSAITAQGNVSNFPLPSENVAITVYNIGGAENDVDGTCGRTFRVHGLDQDFRPVFWANDFVSAFFNPYSLGAGVSSQSPPIFTRVNKLEVLSYGASGVLDPESHIQVLFPSGVPALTLSHNLYFQPDTCFYTVPAGYRCTPRSMRITSSTSSGTASYLGIVDKGTSFSRVIYTNVNNSIPNVTFPQPAPSSAIAEGGSSFVVEALTEFEPYTITADLILSLSSGKPVDVTERTSNDPISGYTLFLDAADPYANGVPPPEHTALARWIDRSEQGHNLSQVYEGQRPVYFPTGANGRPCVRFSNGSKQYMTFGDYAPSIPSQMTLFVVASKTADDFAPIICGGNTGQTGVFSSNEDMFFWGNESETFTVQETSINSRLHIICIKRDSNGGSNSFRGYMNGYETVTGSISEGVANKPFYNIGTLPTLESFFEGDISAILMYPSLLEDIDRLSVNAFLYNRFIDEDRPPVSDFKLFLSARDPLGTGTPPDDDTPLSFWLDKSGNGYNAVQTDPDHRPIFQTTGVTPNPTVQFSASPTRFMTFENGLPLTRYLTVFAVVTKSTSSGAFIWSGNYDNGQPAFASNYDSNDFVWYNGSEQVTLSASNSPSINLLSVVRDDNSGGDFRGYLNGNSVFTNSSFISYQGLSTLKALGYNYQTESGFFEGELSALLIYDRMLENGERALVESYLTDMFMSTIPSMNIVDLYSQQYYLGYPNSNTFSQNMPSIGNYDGNVEVIFQIVDPFLGSSSVPGYLTTERLNGLTVSIEMSTGRLLLTGPVTAVNYTMGEIIFMPAENYASDFTINISVNNGYETQTGRITVLPGYTDSLTGSQLSSFWTTNTAPFESDPGTFTVTPGTNGVTIQGTSNVNFWPGASLQSVATILPTPRNPVMIKFNRFSMSSSGITRSGIRITTPARNNYLFWGQNYGETQWQYNINVTNQGSNINSFNGLNDLDSHIVGIYLDGVNAEFYLDNILGISTAFVISEPVQIELCAFARANDDTVTAVFKDFELKYVDGRGLPPISSFSVFLDAVNPEGFSTPTSDSTLLAQWTDLSGNGNHANQSSGDHQPMYLESGPNSRPSVRFIASHADYLTFDSTTKYFGSQMSVFCVASNTNTYNSYLFSGHANSNNTPAFISGYGPAFEWFNSVDERLTLSDGSDLQTMNILSVQRQDGAFLRGFFNSAFKFNTAPANTLAGGPLSGIAHDSNNGSNFGGDMCAFLFYDTALNSWNRRSTELYLQKRYVYGDNVQPGARTGPGQGLPPIGEYSVFLDAKDPLNTGILPPNGATIATWTDRSGNGYNGVQYSFQDLPVYVNTDEYPTVHFDSYYTQALGFSSGVPVPPEMTLFVVSTASETPGFILHCDGPGGGPRIMSNIVDTPLQWYNDNGFETFPFAHFNSTVTGANMMTVVRTDDSGALKGYINGTQVFNDFAMPGDKTTGKFFSTIGGQFYFPDGFTGSISCILLYPRILNDTERETVQDYLALRYGTSTDAYPATIEPQNRPVRLTGYNRGIITPANSNISSFPPNFGFSPGDNTCFFEQGLSGLSGGLPSNRLITSLLDGTTQFKLAPYNAFNTLALNNDDGTTNTFTFPVPMKFQQLAFLAASSNASDFTTCDITITFADNSTNTSLQILAPDWFYVTDNVAIKNLGRISIVAPISSQTAEGYDSGGNGNPRMYQSTIDMTLLGPGNFPVSSITFTRSSGITASNIFAISGYQPFNAYSSGGGGGGGGGTPPVSGYTNWYDGRDPAGTGTPPTNGATVSLWVNKAGNADYDLTPQFTRTPPTYSASAFGSSGGIVFNGISDALFTTTYFDQQLQNFTIFARYRMTVAELDCFLLASKDNYGGICQVMRNWYQGDGTTKILGHNGSNPFSAATIYSNAFTSSTNPIVVTFRVASDNSASYRINGVPDTTPTTTNSGIYTFGCVGQLGGASGPGYVGDGGGGNISGSVSEIIIYPSVLSDVDCAAVEAYLMSFT